MTTESPAAAGDPSSIRIEVVFALPRQYWSVDLRLPAGATVATALAMPELAALPDSAEVDPSRLAVFSRPVQLSTPLRDGDRLELLRPLTTDPKQGRRARADEAPRKKRD